MDSNTKLQDKCTV